ncbi:MAG: hypothetical protein KF852_20820 [Saprospiraceae bacterium]|nr:hypothetical protein [Saprospiraceae bacterium]
MNVVIIGISLIGFVYLINLNKKQKERLEEKEAEVLKLWDDKIAEHQFLVNVTYRDSESMKEFFDNLNSSYNKLRQLLNQEELTEIDKKQLIDFIINDFTETAGMKKEEVFRRLKVESEDYMFVGDNLEIVKRLERLFNPNFMTKRIYFQDFDIWEKRENWNLNPGDTTVLMIRLLKNYDLNSHQMELIPSEELKVIEPYLGELTVVTHKGAKESKSREISFKIYDWVRQDTIVQKIYLNPN